MINSDNININYNELQPKPSRCRNIKCSPNIFLGITIIIFTISLIIVSFHMIIAINNCLDFAIKIKNDIDFNNFNNAFHKISELNIIEFNNIIKLMPSFINKSENILF